jgi:hypothetical protein
MSDYRLTLSKAEAIVLFEFLSRVGDADVVAIEDEAERRALWDLCCDLERQIDELLLPGYPEILRSARETVRDAGD